LSGRERALTVTSVSLAVSARGVQAQVHQLKSENAALREMLGIANGTS